jgi:serine/threonine protein kinase
VGKREPVKFRDYIISKSLGEGSFGRTFLAHHTVLGNPVCLKQLHTEDPQYIQLFLEEARLLTKVRHPYLPSLLGYWDASAEGLGHVIALSYIEGDSLEKVRQKGAIADEHLCWIADRILEALSYLHYRSPNPSYDRGIIHSDVKPANILLNSKEHEAYLVDFGLAYGAPTASSSPKGGTLEYMPPEFLAGKPPIPPSDLFSLGKVMVEMAGGDLARGQCPSDMAPPLQRWIDRMCAQNPHDRFHSADEAREELRQIRVDVFSRAQTPEQFRYR